MTTNLYWEPVIPPQSRGLTDKLKFAMREAYGGPVNTELGHADRAILHGMVAAGLKEAQELIDLIVKHNTIRVIER